MNSLDRRERGGTGCRNDGNAQVPDTPICAALLFAYKESAEACAVAESTVEYRKIVDRVGSGVDLGGRGTPGVRAAKPYKVEHLCKNSKGRYGCVPGGAYFVGYDTVNHAHSLLDWPRKGADGVDVVVVAADDDEAATGTADADPCELSGASLPSGDTSSTMLLVSSKSLSESCAESTELDAEALCSDVLVWISWNEAEGKAQRSSRRYAERSAASKAAANSDSAGSVPQCRSAARRWGKNGTIDEFGSARSLYAPWPSTGFVWSSSRSGTLWCF